MDHMMPLMDGIETTQKLREGGYNGTIIALTANALVGNEEMFAKNGFNGLIPKPIDIKQLDAALNKFIREKYPEEAKKYKPETVEQTESDEKKQKLIKIFCRDAEKAVGILRQTSTNGDIKLFTTTAHAMKSALGNVGKKEAATDAANLEKAGHEGDRDFIAANTEKFAAMLETLIKELSPVQTAADSNVEEDTAYLKEHLQVIKEACAHYDEKTAYAAFDRLKEKTWKPETTGAIEKIRDMLYLNSDFDGVAEMTEKIG